MVSLSNSHYHKKIENSKKIQLAALKNNQKIDVESLGLDKVDEMDGVLKTDTKKPDIKKLSNNQNDDDNSLNKKNNINKKTRKQGKLNQKNKLSKKPKIIKKNNKKTSPVSIEDYINSKRKSSLRTRLEKEKKDLAESGLTITDNEVKQQKKIEELDDLREKYLTKIDDRSDIFFDEDNFVPTPKKKELRKFTINEEPPEPILNYYRTSENLHIPIIHNPEEKIEILFEAIRSGSIQDFNAAYQNLKMPNVKNKLGDSLLTYATILQKYPIISSLLAKGADPNMPNNLGFSPATIAIEMMDIKSLAILIDGNLDLKYRDGFGRTYLMHASRLGFLAAVELLVSKNIDVNMMDNDGFTALSVAYRHRKEVIIKYLLKNGAKTWVERPYKPENQSIIKELENYWK